VEPAALAASPERIALARERLALLAAAMDELPPRCREVFVLRQVEQLDQAEIARRLCISRNMVEKHLRKALLHCRARVELAARATPRRYRAV
jgi:RNA polymerase sigma factor (sigma-70 family)